MVATLDADIANRYRLIRRIGAGGAGTVYAAADLLLGRTVALKVLHDLHAPALLNGEVYSLARLQHRNIVALHDLVLEGDRASLVMEYVDGCDLERWLSDHNELSLGAALALFASVAAAVAHAHACGILHCDLKPANVLVSRAGEVKLTDFTLARIRAEGHFVGPTGATEAYAAPEQLCGAELDERTDVYGLGALLSRILLAVEATGSDRRLAETTTRATALHPLERFASVTQMLDALPVWADGATRIAPFSTASDFTRVSRAQPRELSVTRRAIQPSRTSRWLLAAGGSVAAVLAVMALWVHVTASASPAPVVLPSLASLEVHSAQLVTHSFALRSTVLWRYSATVPRSIVMGQRPRAGLSVARGSTVTLVVSRGPHPVQVPSLIGLSEDAAKVKLHSLGFMLVEQNQEQVFGSTGTILEQVPQPGRSALPHAVITLTVSRAPWWEFWRSG